MTKKWCYRYAYIANYHHCEGVGYVVADSRMAAEIIARRRCIQTGYPFRGMTPAGQQAQGGDNK